MIQSSGSLHSIAEFIATNIFYLLLAVLLLNLLQRRYQRQSQRKRLATFYLAILILALMVAAIIVVNFRLPDLLLAPVAALLLLIAYLNRKHVFPFRLNCRKCGQRLSGKRILFFDANTCERCEPIISPSEES